MPYLQLDVSASYLPGTKQALARRLAATYVEHMNVDIRRVSIAIRELGEAGLWRLIDGEPTPANLLMCDIRSGRSPAQRLALAQALVAVCSDVLGIAENRLNVEFTQHAGDEMYHPALGGLSPDWSSDGD